MVARRLLRRGGGARGLPDRDDAVMTYEEYRAEWEIRFRRGMRRGHPRWQAGREWSHEWQNPVPLGAVVSVWLDHADAWIFHRRPERCDWQKVRAYRLEHGVPYPDGIPAPKPIPPELAGTLHPLLQYRFDRIDAEIARLVAAAGLEPR